MLKDNRRKLLRSDGDDIHSPHIDLFLNFPFDRKRFYITNIIYSSGFWYFPCIQTLNILRRFRLFTRSRRSILKLSSERPSCVKSFVTSSKKGRWEIQVFQLTLPKKVDACTIAACVKIFADASTLFKSHLSHIVSSIISEKYYPSRTQTRRQILDGLWKTKMWAILLGEISYSSGLMADRTNIQHIASMLLGGKGQERLGFEISCWNTRQRFVS